MISDSSLSADDRNPVDVLADEFAARLRQGESPSMQEYIDRYPQHASEIAELFPGVALLEQLSRRQESEVSSRQRSRQHSLPPGHRFGDIEIVRELGRGGMGIVYEAYQHSLSRAVAVKAIHTGSVHSAHQAARFQREAQAAAQLHHTNIVPVFGVGEQEGTSYYVMQLIHGQGLDAVLTELARKLRIPRGSRPDRGGTPQGNGAEPAKAEQRVESAGSMDSFSARELADILVSGKLSETSLRSGSGAALRSRADRDATVPFHPAEASASEPESGSELESRQEDRTEDRTADVGASETPRQGVRSSLELRDEPRLPAGVRSSLVLRDLSLAGETFQPADGAGSLWGEEGADAALNQLGLRYWRNIARIGVQVASGLQYAHAQGTLHRDIKPANILLDTEGTAWIADFGLAKVLQQEDVTRTGDVVGTLRYMAPEQFRGETDGRSDLYSLGLTLYELLTLRPAYEETDRQKLIAQKLSPHDPPHPRWLHPGIPRDLETIVIKCLAWEPDGRYPTAGALVGDLQAFLDDRPIQARRISSAERFWRWCRRNPVVAGLSTAVVLLLMAHATLATFGYFREKDRAEKMAALSELAESRREAAEKSAFEAEQLADVQWDALNRIYQTFVPERFAAPVEASADADSEDESALEGASVAPVLSPQTAAMLEEMLTSFERIATIRGTDERYLEETARANRKVGDLHLRLGQYEEAADAFERAIERYRKLQEIRGAETEILVRLARLHNGLGISWQHRRDVTKAREALGTSLTILQSSPIERSDPSVLHETAWTYYLLGRLRGAPPPRRDPERRGDARTADAGRPGITSPVSAADRPAANESAEQTKNAATAGTAAPDTTTTTDIANTVAPGSVAPTRSGRARTDEAAGLFPGPPAPPLPFVVDVVAARDDRSGQRSAERGRGGERGRDRGVRGRGRTERGDLDGRGGWVFRDNDEHLQKAIAILEPLIEAHPDVAEYRFLDALCHIELSNPRFLPPGVSGDEHLNEAIELLTVLVSEDPDEPDYLYQLSEAYQQRYLRWRRDFRPLFMQEYSQRGGPWDWSTDLTEIDAAEADLQKAVQLSNTLMRQQPNVARYAESHHSLLFNLADVETVQGDTDEARRLLAEGDQVLHILSRFPQVAETSWYREARREMLRAQVQLQSGQANQAVDQLRQVLEQIPTVDEGAGRGWLNRFRRDLQAHVHQMLAAAHDRLGDSASAEEARRQARALRSELRDRFESSSDRTRSGATN
jgi:tetratricopeptide (TPR) repeat protein